MVRILLEYFLVDSCEDFQNLRWGQDPNNEDDWKQYDFYDQLVTAEVSVKFIFLTFNFDYNIKNVTVISVLRN